MTEPCEFIEIGEGGSFVFRCNTCGSEFEDVLAGQIAQHGRLLNKWWCGDQISAADPMHDQQRAAK